jgi:hypothetical protein
MEPSTVLERNPDVVARDLADGGAVLLNLETGAYHGLNSTGLIAWNAVDQPRSVAEILDSVRQSLSAAPDSLDTDVRSFLESAVERDLLRLAA